MSEVTCEKLVRCFLWFSSIGEKHHCTIIEPPKKKKFIDPKQFYGKY